MKRKAGKCLILAMLACCIMSASVDAATIDLLKLNAGNIDIEGASSNARVSYKIYKSSSAGTAISDICEMGEAEVSDGKFSISLKMPEIMQGAETDGNYIIEIKDNSKVSQSFLFTGHSYRTEFIASINSKTASADILSVFEGNSSDSAHGNIDIMRNLGVDTDYYSALDTTKKNALAAAFLTEKGTTAVDEANFSEIYNKAQAVQYLNSNSVTDAWLSESSLAFEGVDFKDAGADLQAWISGVVGDGTVYNSYSAIEGKYREANVLYLLNNAKFTEFDALIAGYDDAIGIVGEAYYNTYKSMKALNKANVNAALKNAIALSKPNTKEEFKAAYKKAIEDEVAAMNKQNIGAGGGGGGGGTSSSVGGVAAILPEKTNPTKVVTEFSDIESVAWAKDAIMALAQEGVVSGYDDGTFKPQQSIKREEFVKMVIAAAHIDLDKPACKFGDVGQDKWYAQYVNAAYGAGIIAGTSETEFGIGKGITREDMAVIIARLIDIEAEATDAVFSDDADIAEYARESIYKLYRAGKIAGVGNNEFAPKEIVTRAQAAKIIYDTLVSGN